MQVVDELNRLAAAFIGLQRSVQGSSFEAVSSLQHHLQHDSIALKDRSCWLCKALACLPPAQPSQGNVGGSLGWRSLDRHE